ncbi:GAF domain-containing protein [Spirulina sp. 06S082]|uniref:GAF domain-containing protein n=1 Tax=Spirulina sp. 06S082 TaxID=3110248 RepID=UPI002B1FFC2F|nr:GAF domain-containing protein [Spirulina sp. 06S082]MEA5471678.1 GAF domain-containing protein [Spirulina sp. 06S082]
MPDPGLRKLTAQLSRKLQQDRLLQETVTQLRYRLNCDRVLLYYFYRQWQGQVTFESLKAPEFSIFGSTGADECFNDEYALLYQQGRIRAIADIETEPLHPCHQEFLRSLQICANLVVPILTSRLWGLLIAHDCTKAHTWLTEDIDAMQIAANKLALFPTICEK